MKKTAFLFSLAVALFSGTQPSNAEVQQLSELTAKELLSIMYLHGDDIRHFTPSFRHLDQFEAKRRREEYADDIVYGSLDVDLPVTLEIEMDMGLGRYDFGNKVFSACVPGSFTVYVDEEDVGWAVIRYPGLGQSSSANCYLAEQKRYFELGIAVSSAKGYRINLATLDDAFAEAFLKARSDKTVEATVECSIKNLREYNKSILGREPIGLCDVKYLRAWRNRGDSLHIEMFHDVGASTWHVSRHE